MFDAFVGRPLSGAGLFLVSMRWLHNLRNAGSLIQTGRAIAILGRERRQRARNRLIADKQDGHWLLVHRRVPPLEIGKPVVTAAIKVLGPIGKRP